MKGFMEEFKKFISRGNVMDMAVGIIIGGAFTAIVTALVDSIIMPLISVIFGGISFEKWNIVMGPGEEAPVLGLGTFVAAIINFLLIALVIFCLLKSFNKMSEKVKKPEEEAAPTTKKCPCCFSEIAIEATRCPHCTSELPAEE
ncbi:MAG: large conductance mechanosensitive channel protein MscL [Eubacteriales bacterium]|nr:large conductance mechanosensitive channel protein MscL [Eubacteriales bacterium]